MALMGFGFVVARFGLFLQALDVRQAALAHQPFGISVWFGTALLVLGVVVNILAAWNHIRLVRELNRGGSGFTRPSSLAIGVALFLALAGLAMAAYVTSVHETNPSKLGQMSILRHSV